MNKILEKIQKAGHIVLISHKNPDADSLGSASAMYSFLLQKHKKVSWFCTSKEIAQKFSFLPWFEKIKSSFPASADLAIVFNCANREHLGLHVECELINIDRHSTNENYGDFNFVKSDFISTTALLYDFFKKNSVKVNKKMATAIYAGLLDSSDAFLSQKVDGTTFATVGELIALGADFKLCHERVVKSVSLATLRLKSVMFKNMLLEQNARVSVFCVSSEDMAMTGAVADDCEAALEDSLRLPHVEVALLLMERSNLDIKCSLRSNYTIDVGKIAASFGGGGDFNRAGFETDKNLSLHEVKIKLLDSIKKEF